VSKSDSGYIIKIRAGNVVMTGAEFAKILGLNSACMTIENLNGSIKITTKGVGEGFGVSIYTAEIMASQGSSYEEILKKFYSGVQIVSL
jgi:stage II sporulation protein D